MWTALLVGSLSLAAPETEDVVPAEPAVVEERAPAAFVRARVVPVPGGVAVVGGI